MTFFLIGTYGYKLSHVHCRRQVISELLLRIRPRYHHIFFMMMNDDSVRTEKSNDFYLYMEKDNFSRFTIQRPDIIKQVYVHVKMTKNQ